MKCPHNSVELTNAVCDQMEDMPSHTVVSMHEIVKQVLAVLDEWGFLTHVEGAGIGDETDGT